MNTGESYKNTLQYVVTQARNYIIEDRKDDDLSREDINKYVAQALKASTLRTLHTNVIKNYFEQLVGDAHRALETEFSITVSDTLYVIDNGTQSWLTDAGIREMSSDSLGFWNRYRGKLLKKWPLAAVESLDRSTNTILGFLGNPQALEFKRKGLVIGDIQSGKTANYAGLINKAADAGYQLIIVIAGLLSSLRTQTQLRLEVDFSGRITHHVAKNNIRDHVGTIHRVRKDPTGLTDYENSFSKRSISRQLPNFRGGEIAFAVINKNASILRNLRNYLGNIQKAELHGVSVLIIDDEADNASINSNPDKKLPTRINREIRALLSLFKKVTYVGYTATPFANIFINPELTFGKNKSVEMAMKEQDLFPRDFIVSLGTPSNYVSALKLFCAADDDQYASKVVRTIGEESEFMDALKERNNPDLPESLIEAIYTFVLARAIRNARRESSEHCSMLIHISLKKIDHAVLMKKVESVVTDLLNSIDSFIALESPELKDSHIKRLKDVWDKQYEGTGISETWGGICSEMRRDGFTESFKVYKLNSDLKSNEDELCELDYDKSPGQSPIIIGGNRLSRGLTFEGLVVSYFLRRSSQYDTLMQMGRWFGYRDGYAEICRVFIPLSLQACFSEIAQATEELKSSIDDMLHSGMSPLEFGLRVRNNIPGLQVTARNKMRHTMIQHENLDFTDSYLSSYRVPSSPDSIKSNNLALEKFIAKLNKKYHLREASEDEVQVGKIWEGVAASDIIDYMQECCDMKSHSYFDPSCLEDYVSKVGVLDVAFIDKDDQFTGTNSDMGTMNIDGLGKVCLPVRVPYTDSEGFIHFKKNRVFSRHHELGHQTKEDIESWKRHYVEDKKVKTVTIHDLPSRYYRKKAGRRDLMLISFVRIPGRDLFDHEGKAVKTLKEMSEEDLSRRVAVYGFSFSWRKEEEYRATKYVVNAVIMDRVKSDEEDDE